MDYRTWPAERVNNYFAAIKARAMLDIAGLDPIGERKYYVVFISANDLCEIVRDQRSMILLSHDLDNDFPACDLYPRYVGTLGGLDLFVDEDRAGTAHVALSQRPALYPIGTTNA